MIPIKIRRRENHHPKYRCNWCQKTFQDEAALDKHTKSTGERVLDFTEQRCVPFFRCEWCDAGFDTNADLSEHMRREVLTRGLTYLECLSSPNNSQTEDMKEYTLYESKVLGDGHAVHQTYPQAPTFFRLPQYHEEEFQTHYVRDMVDEDNETASVKSSASKDQYTVLSGQDTTQIEDNDAQYARESDGQETISIDSDELSRSSSRSDEASPLAHVLSVNLYSLKNVDDEEGSRSHLSDDWR
ncbi:hypothetical protein EK21DRAFT_107112 [Setomelanomma holmii]|uniref:C2H2-type domain-containing protein n=1 Tax=Setomelanomma holmii TaxID=210430 RepID=A0A9P4HI10_9PLEO|nr:hypothetical protein EK21DRAFT_107112 [Setomelanomma holmii]